MKTCLPVIIALLALPAGASPLLQGKVEKQEIPLMSQIPKEETVIDETIDWTAWNNRLFAELHKRLQEKIHSGWESSSGSIDIEMTVYKDGSINADIQRDMSTNLGILIPNILDRLEGDPILKFPEGSQRETIVIDYTFTVGPGQERPPEPYIEHIKKYPNFPKK